MCPSSAQLVIISSVWSIYVTLTEHFRPTLDCHRVGKEGVWLEQTIVSESHLLFPSATYLKQMYAVSFYQELHFHLGEKRRFQ